MALPKRQQSRSRRNKRRTHDALTAPNIPTYASLQKGSHGRSKRFICSQCKQIKVPHTVCHNCGFYNGKQVIEIER
ncbi:MAG: 50S ribosomal protein L32 [Candidatus Anammoxibacter sp.]